MAIAKYSTLLELSNFMNSLKPLFSIGCMRVRLLAKRFDCRQSRFWRLRPPKGQIPGCRLQSRFCYDFFHPEILAVRLTINPKIKPFPKHPKRFSQSNYFRWMTEVGLPGYDLLCRSQQAREFGGAHVLFQHFI